MGNLRCPALSQPDGDDVKPVPVALPPESRPPALRRPGQRPEFLPTKGLERVATGQRGAGLDLDEDHELPAPDDEINIVTADAETVPFHIPSPGGQPGERELLAAEATDVARVGPIDNGNKGAGRHERKIVPGLRMGGTGLNRRGAAYCRYSSSWSMPMSTSRGLLPSGGPRIPA